MKIGHVIRRIRRSQERTLQQVCDAASGRVTAAYLSRIERDEMSPSVYIAAAIARALGTTVDSLLLEAEGAANTDGLPTESRTMLPVLEWGDAWQFLHGEAAPEPAGWVMPPMPAGPGMFGLVLPDDSMQALEGISWSRGGVIIIDPAREAQTEDYVLISDQGLSDRLVFRQLVADGPDRILRARNPQFPIRQIDKGWQVMGVVIGQVLDLTQNE